MDKLNIAIADDNAEGFTASDKIVSSDEELNVVGKAGNGEDLYDIIKSRSRMSYFWIWSCPKSMG